MNKIWFKAKRYGYGWYPASWEGWLILAVFFVLMFIPVPIIASLTNSDAEFTLVYIPVVIVVSGLLVLVAYLKGEPAKWRWGDSKETPKKP